MRRLLLTLLAVVVLLTQYGLNEHIYSEHLHGHAHHHEYLSQQEPLHDHDDGGEQDSDEVCFLYLASHQYQHALIPSLSLSFNAGHYELQAIPLQAAIAQTVIPSYSARAPPRFL